MAREKEIYIGFCERWRNIPKPTLAAVQGKVIAGGLMLIWPCDIIIASDDAQFCDPVVNFGPREKLDETVLAMAQKIAKKSLFALKLTKEAVNVAEDAQGRVQSMQTSFALHQLTHTHWLE